MRAVTFDFGQTLAELDHDFLMRRVHSFGAQLDPTLSRAATVTAWHAYGAAKALGHARAWQAMMLEILRGGGVRKIRAEAADPAYPEKIAQLLWDAQPTQNLWRKPIPGMFELVSELAARQVPVGIISNSEGHLAELVEELGYSALFRVVIDSGRVGVDKDPRIFQLGAEALGVPLAEIVHVGDAWEADVIGARAAGARAIWYAPTDNRALPEGVVACRDASELSLALRDFGVG
ncbi:MAG: HAD family hydrolase [Pseudomonadota bacterium]